MTTNGGVVGATARATRPGLRLATVHHVDAAGRDAHAAMGFEAGWNRALDQLVELMQATPVGAAPGQR